MPPQPWPIVIDGIYGDVPNGFYAAQDTGQKMVLLPFGGLRSLCQFPNCSEIREAWAWNEFMYFLARRGSQSILFRTDDTGAFTEIGTVTTSSTGPAWMKNNQSQLGIVDGVTRWVFTPSLNLLEQSTDLNFRESNCKVLLKYLKVSCNGDTSCPSPTIFTPFKGIR